MRRSILLFAALAGGLSLLPEPPAAAAADARPARSARPARPLVAELVQAPESDRGLVLAVRGRRVRALWEGGRARAFRLRRGEILASVADTGSGWVAAGIRAGAAGSELFVVEKDVGVRRRLRPPAAAPGAALRLLPVPLVAEGRLAGLAWLEGDDPRRTAVRAAARTATGWGPVRTVSPAGPGSQTGLAAAALADGTTLLAWAAFDGRDDEILWSRSRGDGWERPRPLHPGNAAPDVTPALVATRRGALAVWSRLDGGTYRLYLSRFERGRWSAPRPVAGAGSLYPALVRLPRGLFLVHLEAAPAAWAVAELGEDGRPLRRARFAAAGARPALGGATAAGASLRRPAGARRESAPWRPAP